MYQLKNVVEDDIMGENEIAEVMEKVKSWLVEEGIYREEVPDEDARYHFAVEFPPGSGMRSEIIQPKDKKDLLLIVSGVELAEIHYNALRSMPKTKRDELLWEIRFELLFRDSDFQIIPSAEDFRRIQFVRPIYFDGLTKDKLFECLRENFKCKLYIIWKMNQLFGEKPPKHETPVYG